MAALNSVPAFFAMKLPSLESRIISPAESNLILALPPPVLIIISYPEDDPNCNVSAVAVLIKPCCVTPFLK